MRGRCGVRERRGPSALAQLVEAAVAFRRGDAERSRQLLAAATVALTATDMHLYAAAARRRQAQLLEGTAGTGIAATGRGMDGGSEDPQSRSDDRSAGAGLGWRVRKVGRMAEASPSLIVLAGPNGAGKTTAARTLLAETLQVMTFVNADVIAQGLAGFDPESAALEASRIMLERLHALAEQRADFAFETTLAGRTLARLAGGSATDRLRCSSAILLVEERGPGRCSSGRSGANGWTQHTGSNNSPTLPAQSLELFSALSPFGQATGKFMTTASSLFRSWSLKAMRQGNETGLMERDMAADTR